MTTQSPSVTADIPSSPTKIAEIQSEATLAEPVASSNEIPMNDHMIQEVMFELEPNTTPIEHQSQGVSHILDP
ncbi:hypothetical protein V6N13_142207 [Hibiscus sabdariffa]|uniref:Uncharacterized protein n=1 Tax=Hibiscus sabdariffa TaxID=183260 RepID=A0ABR2FDJ2_9ROSI